MYKGGNGLLNPARRVNLLFFSNLLFSYVHGHIHMCDVLYTNFKFSYVYELPSPYTNLSNINLQYVSLFKSLSEP